MLKRLPFGSEASSCFVKKIDTEGELVRRLQGLSFVEYMDFDYEFSGLHPEVNTYPGQPVFRASADTKGY